MPSEMTPFQAAYLRYQEAGAAHAADDELMAAFCKHDLQLLVGAASPQLVWEGAQARFLTTRDLLVLCNENPSAVHDLMWG